MPAAAPAGARVRSLPRHGTSTFERLGRLPDHRLVDGLLRSRGWIVVIGVLLGGIVAMQVSLLKLNSGISRAVETSATLERQNADMQASIARLSSSQRVSSHAAQEDMVFPPAGAVRYLNVRPSRDPALAARRMTAPSASAQALMAAGGHATGTSTTATTSTATTAPTTSSATTATPTSTTSSTTTPSTTTTSTAESTTPSTTTTSTAESTTPSTTTSTPASTTTPSTTSSAASAAATAAAAGQG